MLLVDFQIRKLCQNTSSEILPMIEPFSEAVSGNGLISFGLTHAGYDLRLDNSSVLVFKNTHGLVVDPKKFKDLEYRSKVFDRIAFEPHQQVIIAANSYILGQSYEYLRIPLGLKGRVVGKSTLARCGIIINTTPIEPLWEGHLTIEIANTNPSPVCVYTMEGVAQLEFEQLDALPETSYADKNGIYMGQVEVTPARVRT